MSTKTLNEYYADIAQRVIELMGQNKLKEALAIVDEELQQPYVPTEFFHNLNQIKNDIELQIKEEAFNNKISKMSKLQVWDLVYNEKTNKFDEVYFNILLSQYNDELDEVDLSIINKILKNKKVDNVCKSIMLNYLREVGIDHKFDIYNNFLDEMFSINPMETTEFDKQVDTIIKAIEKKFIQDPSKLEIAMSLVQVLGTKFIPCKIKFNNNDIINTVINITNSLFDDEKLIKNDIVDLLKEFIY